MEESFEQTIAARAQGGERYENTLATWSSQIQNTGYTNDDTQNSKGNKIEVCIDEIFFFLLQPVNIV